MANTMGIEAAITEAAPLLIKAVQNGEPGNHLIRYTDHGLRVKFASFTAEEVLDAFIEPFKAAGWGFHKYTMADQVSAVTLTLPAELTQLRFSPETISQLRQAGIIPGQRPTSD